MKPVLLKDFIKKVDLNKFPNITVMDEFESIDGDDIVKRGVLREKVFKTDALEALQEELQAKCPDAKLKV